MILDRLTTWIKGAINKMLGIETLKKQFDVDIAINQPMTDAITTWAALYAGQAPWLSDPTIKSLNLPAAIAGEIARVATIEMKVEITGSKRADYLQDQFNPLIENIRRYLEYGAAKGGLVFKPYVSGQDIAIDIVHQDQFYPVKFDSRGNLVEAIFSDRIKKGDTWYTKLEYHQGTENGCLIRNLVFKSKNQDMLGTASTLEAVPEWAGILPEATITGINRPLFAYFRYPLANHVDQASPLGVSCYSRAVPLIEQADRLWSQLLWEFESGQRALYADVTAFTKDPNGDPILPNKRLYRGLNALGNIGTGDLFKEWSPTLREKNILNGLDAVLKKIEFTTGLAYGTVSDPTSVDKTATEIKISRQRTYSTITDVQKAIKDVLVKTIEAADVYATLYNLAPRGEYATAFEFDDSTIVDKDAQFTQDLRLVQQGLMSRTEFRVRNMGEDEETAKARIQDATIQGPTDYFSMGT